MADGALTNDMNSGTGIQSPITNQYSNFVNPNGIMSSQDVERLMAQQQADLTSYMIRDLINEHTTERNRCLELWRKYKGDVLINSRSFQDTTKVNNKLANDFRGIIIDQSTGYVFGKPIVTTFQNGNDKIVNEFNSFSIRNNLSDLDYRTGEMAAVCGYAGRLCYIDKEGKERVIPLRPWETIFIKDQILEEYNYALVYYNIIQKGINNQSTIITKAEFYDGVNVTFLLSNADGAFYLDPDEPINPRPHGFDYMPVVKVQNNNTEQGDFEKVEALIDDYDLTMSNNSNEIGEVNQAILALIGIGGLDEDQLRAVKQTRAIGLPEGTDAKFLIKDINPAFVENHKTTLNENIYKFSSTVDMTAENFSGSGASGESRKWLLVGLENKAIKKENKFIYALRQQYKIIASAWKKKGLALDVEDMKFQFTRNLPVDLLYSAQVTDLLMGKVSEETRLSLLPFVENAKDELKKLGEDKAAYQEDLNYSTDQNLAGNDVQPGKDMPIGTMNPGDMQKSKMAIS